ncbi:MAG: carbohydrate-binding domain-containing protein [Lachnospiraceae bacterium]|nr:carbohydrate-binding domain-containing protein [Lachnospiraceae bacterium]
MRRNMIKKVTAVSAGIILASAVGAGSMSTYAAESKSFSFGSFMQQQMDQARNSIGNMFDNIGNSISGYENSLGNELGGFGVTQGMQGQDMMMGNATYADSPTDIVTSTVTNTAASLTADYSNATTYVMSDSNNDIKISEAGTYIVTGSCSDGNITVKKGTTGVVLILKDLDLTSTTGATVSLNKTSEVKLIIEGTVNLTDAEDPSDEESTDTEVADAFDGAAIKAKDGSNVYLTGTGTLNIDASSCKNGIKVGDADYPSFVIDGSLTININAANDAINAGYDLTILSGNINITAGDDALHADRIITLGSSDGSGPSVYIKSCVEGIEGTVVNLFGGSGTVNASDDGVNAANSDGTYSSEMEFSINITGGTWNINCNGDGLDSNGNINITGGYTVVKSGTTGGEAGLDFVGSCYVADGCLENNCGASCDGAMGGQTGMYNQQMPEQMNEMTQNQGTDSGSLPGQSVGNEVQNQKMPGMSGEQSMGNMNGQMPEMSGQQMQGQMPEMPGQQMQGQMPEMPGQQMPGQMGGQMGMNNQQMPGQMNIGR